MSRLREALQVAVFVAVGWGFVAGVLTAVDALARHMEGP